MLYCNVTYTAKSASVICRQSMYDLINASNATDRDSHLIVFKLCVLKLVLCGSRRRTVDTN
jgi:hypothetical protein